MKIRVGMMVVSALFVRIAMTVVVVCVSLRAIEAMGVGVNGQHRTARLAVELQPGALAKESQRIFDGRCLLRRAWRMLKTNKVNAWETEVHTHHRVFNHHFSLAFAMNMLAILAFDFCPSRQAHRRPHTQEQGGFHYTREVAHDFASIVCSNLKINSDADYCYKFPFDLRSGQSYRTMTPATHTREIALIHSTSLHGMWSSRLAFIAAATGSAVGLGNIWRFPYITSENGGGAFVLIYLGCILLVGLPIMLSEIMIGRRGRMSPINSLRELSVSSGASRKWMGLGIMGVIAGFLILSFYSVVAGWTLHYGFLYLKMLFGGPGIADPGATFGSLLGNASELTFWHGVFMLMTVLVVGMGVEKGLERAVTILMPLLLALLLILLGYAMNTGYFYEGMGFLFRPDWSQVNGTMVVVALGQAFFTLSLGMCTMMTYGAYLPNNVNIPQVGVSVAAADTVMALVAGMAIFPIIIAYGLDPAGGGAGLIFTSLPLAFADMPYGLPYGFLFFTLLSVAAWTSSISLMEPATAYLVEATNLTRRKAALLVAALGWLFGLVSVFSFNMWEQVRILGRNPMDAIDYVATQVMLPVGGLLTALFAGWVLSRKITREELGENMPNWAFTAWLWITRVITPALILVVMASILGFFD